MTEFSQHLSPEQEEQMKQFQERLVSDQADQSELASVTSIHGEKIQPSAEAEQSVSVDVTHESVAHVVTVRGRRGSYRPQGPPDVARPRHKADADKPDEGGVVGGKYAEVQQKVYKNGAKHVYGIDAEGKQRHLSHDEILETYGYAGQYQGKHVKDEQATSETEKPETVESPESESSRTDAVENSTRVETEPVTELSEKGIRSRLNRIFKKAQYLGVLYKNDVAAGIGKAKEYLSDEEKGKSRKLIAGAVVGATAVAAVAAVYFKMHHGMESGPVQKGSGSNDTLKHLLDGRGDNPAGAGDTVKHVTETLNHKGDTVWSHAQHELTSHGNLHPSELQIHAETQRILDLNNMSWDDARHLSVGTKLKVS